MDEQLLDEVSAKIPCREEQITQLSLLIDSSIPNSSAVVLHGTTATAKSVSVCAVLSSQTLPYAIVSSRECITGRHLLERTVASVRASLASHSLLASGDDGGSSTIRVESLSALTSQLSVLLSSAFPSRSDSSQGSQFVLVFDGVDKQREAPATLLPALARLSEVIPVLTVVIIVTSPRARYLHRPGVPHIQFEAYSRDQIIEILSSRRLVDGWRPPRILPASSGGEEGTADAATGDDDNHEDDDDAFLWTRFVGAVWDSLGKGAARDLVSLRALCERLWPAFVAPVQRGEYGAREFARLMVRNRALFQSEAALHEGLLAPATLTEADFDSWRSGGSKKTSMTSTNTTTNAASSSETTTATTTTTRGGKGAHELPYYGKFLLIAAFIASHNPARTDAVLFMKMHEKRRKKIAGAGYRGPGRPPKHRRGITRKLLGPQPFGMERWLAMFYAIVPDGADDDDDDDDDENNDEAGEDTGGKKANGKASGVKSGKARAAGAGARARAIEDELTGSADLLTQIATLAALRLIVKASLSSNIMDASTKWRANVGLEYVQGLAKQVRFDVGDYLTEG